MEHLRFTFNIRNFHLPLEYQYLEQVNLLHHHHSLFSFFCFERSELSFYDNHKCKDALPETEKFHRLLNDCRKMCLCIKNTFHSELLKIKTTVQTGHC